MIELNGKKMCECCFAEIQTDTCPHCGYNKNTYVNDPIVLPCGSILAGRYIVGNVIGKGGFGITYLAYDNKMDTKVAIKEYYPNGLATRSLGKTTLVVSNDSDAQSFQVGAEKFYNEAKLVSKFNGNPGIVSVYEFFYENDTVYFAMEFLSGRSLKDYLDEKGAISEGEAVYIADCVSSALLAAHSSSVMHRDISPDNIMLCDDGTVKLIDFGAARQVTAESSQNLSVILKPGFAPLEQYQKKGKQGPWTDIYALGATLFYALTLDTIDDPMTRMEDDSEFEKNAYNISENLWDIIRNATMLKANERYQDIFVFRNALSASGIEPVQIVAPRKEEAVPEFRTAQPFNQTKAVETVQTPVTPAPFAAPVAANVVTEKAASFMKSKKGMIAMVSAVAVVVIGILIGVIASGGKDDDDYIPVSSSNNESNVTASTEDAPVTEETSEDVLEGADYWDGTTDISWFTDGEKIRYEISTAEQLAGLAYLVNYGEDMEGIMFELMNDIVLNENWTDLADWIDNPPENIWTPIGDNSRFEGKFNGNGNQIFGLCTDRNSDYAGLFGNIWYAEIKNLSVVGLAISTNKEYPRVGLIAGDATYSQIENCMVAGGAWGESETHLYVGGIIGHSSSCTIKNCLNKSVVYAMSEDSSVYSGGIAGDLYDSTATSCANTGFAFGEVGTEDESCGVGAIFGSTLNLSGSNLFYLINPDNSNYKAFYDYDYGGIDELSGTNINNGSEVCKAVGLSEADFHSQATADALGDAFVLKDGEITLKTFAE